MKAIAVKRGPKGFKATICICSVKPLKKLFIYVNVKIAANTNTLRVEVLKKLLCEKVFNWQSS